MNNDENIKLANMLFPDSEHTIDYYETLYPARDLPAGAYVTRFAPSPTGFVHIGSLLPSLVAERLARQTGGVFYLRIEDTDKKREVTDATKGILKSLYDFDIIPDEGPLADGVSETGLYGPYTQSLRIEIYHCCAKYLVSKGLAYPCFCSEEQNDETRRKQEEVKADPGYYGEWAIHRRSSFDEIKVMLDNNVPFVLRLRASDNTGNKVVIDDAIKGHIELPENFQDTILLKSNKIPTYHFAHVVDDHFMRTTHVIRGDEWLSSVPVHLQLFSYFGWDLPVFAHISPVMKEDGNSRRKLAKRKDPEAAVLYYHEKGYPNVAVQEYLLNLVNSGYEDWRRSNPGASNREFNVDLGKMSISGALFDLVKLNDVSCNTIALMTAEDVYDQVLCWANEYDPGFAALLSADPEYAIKIFSIERGGPKPRKDISVWSQVKDYASFFFDDLFMDFDVPHIEENLKECRVLPEDRKLIIAKYLDIYDPADDSSVWFDKIRILSDESGYTKDMKAYRKDPSGWKGNVSDVCALFRILITGGRMSPDLWSIMQVLGPERVKERLSILL